MGTLASVHINLWKVSLDFLFPEALCLTYIDLWSWWPEYGFYFLFYISLFTNSKNKAMKCSVEISQENMFNILDQFFYLI